MDPIAWNNVFDAIRKGDSAPFARALKQAVTRHPQIRGKPPAELLRQYGQESKDIVQELAYKVLKDRALMQDRLHLLADYVLGSRVNRVLENLLIDQARAWRGRRLVYDDKTRVSDGVRSEGDRSGTLIDSYVPATISPEEDYIAKISRERVRVDLTDRQRFIFENSEVFGGEMTVAGLKRVLGIEKSTVYGDIESIRQRLAALMGKERTRKK